MWLLFQHVVLLLATCLLRLKHSQTLCRIKSNAVFSLFWQQLGQTKRPHYMLAKSYTHSIGFSNKKYFSYPSDCVGGVTEPTNCVSSSTGSTLFVIPPNTLPKTLHLWLDTESNNECLKCFVKLEMHSQGHKGEMSYWDMWYQPYWG